MVYYLVFLLIIHGEPMTLNSLDRGVFYRSMDKCIEAADTEIERMAPKIKDQPESFVTAVCLKRDFTNISKS